MNYKVYKKSLMQRTTFLIIITSVMSVIIALLSFVVPLMLNAFIDNYKVGDKIFIFVIVVLAFYICSYLAKMILNKINNYNGVKFKSKEHMRLLDIMFHMNYGKLITYEPTYLAQRIAICVNTLYSVYGEAVSKFVVAILNIVISIIITLKINWIITCVLILILVIQVLGYKRINTALQNKCVHLQDVSSKCFMNILSITAKTDYIKQEGDYQGIARLLKPHVTMLHNENSKVAKFGQYISTSVEAIITLLHNAIYIVTAIFVVENKLTTADFILISMVTSLYMNGVSSIVGININLRDLKGVEEFIEKDLIGNIEASGSVKLEIIKSIEFDIKDFGYGENILIERGSFSLQKGDIAVVSGESGCGKTSMMKALLGFMDIHDIRINGQDIHELDISSLRKHIQFFSQNMPIITGTIKENILMGMEADKEKLKALEQKSYLQKFYTFPEGLETKILENGSNLSGGDKQKIILARLYLQSPDVIILDESTNSIDEDSAKEIVLNVINEFNDKIVIIISHDLYLKTLATKIINISNKIVSEGLIDLNSSEQ